MTQAFSNKQILHVAYPILISLVMEQLIGMTDTAFLGRVGEVELGASAIGGIFYLAIFMIGFGFSIGSQILIARRNGEQHYEEIGDIFYQGLYFMLVLATLTFAGTRFLAPHILPAIVASPKVCAAALDYLEFRVIGFFFSFVAVMFRAFFVGTTQTKTLTLNSLVMVGSNILFNYILIFGKLGFPQMGIAGAALGSSMAEMVSAVFFILYTLKRINLPKYGLNKVSRFNRKRLAKILNISFWTMIQNFFSLSTWFMFFLFVEHLGERSLAITNIIRNISGILFMVISAFSATCSSLVSNLMGRGDTEQVRPTIWQHVRLAYYIIIPLAALFAALPHLILGIYTDMTDLIEAAIPSLWVFCTTPMITALGNIFFQAVSGTGNTRVAFILESVTLCVYALYIYVLIMLMRTDVAWCWTSEHIYGLVIFVLCFQYIRKGKWIGKQI